MADEEYLKNLKSSFNNLKSNDEEYFSEKKNSLLQMFESNLKKTFETINSYKPGVDHHSSSSSEETPQQLNEVPKEANPFSNANLAAAESVKISDFIGKERTLPGLNN